MITCGVELVGSKAHLVLLDGTKEEYSFIKLNMKKLALEADENAEAVKEFQDTIFAFFRENSVGAIFIKKRSKKGEYSGGPVGFKIEGIVQLYTECQVSLFSPPTIGAAMRRHAPGSPDGMLKYQQGAFETAFTGLP